jgi:hypothetical protein
VKIKRSPIILLSLVSFPTASLIRAISDYRRNRVSNAQAAAAAGVLPTASRTRHRIVESSSDDSEDNSEFLLGLQPRRIRTAVRRINLRPRRNEASSTSAAAAAGPSSSAVTNLRETRSRTRILVNPPQPTAPASSSRARANSAMSVDQTSQFASSNYRPARIARREAAAAPIASVDARTVHTFEPIRLRSSSRRNGMSSPHPAQSQIPRPVRAARMNPTVITIDDSDHSDSIESRLADSDSDRANFSIMTSPPMRIVRSRARPRAAEMVDTDSTHAAVAAVRND